MCVLSVGPAEEGHVQWEQRWTASPRYLKSAQHQCITGVGHFVGAFETALLVTFVIHLAYLLVPCSLHPTERGKTVSVRTGGTFLLFWPTQRVGLGLLKAVN